jgi:predicted DNA-binding transcriptional regulator AlpA
MARKLTFQQLKTEKGWPYSRQHTHKLVKARRFPPPDKLYEGGLLNVWDEDAVDAHLAKRKFESSASPEAA